MQIKLPIIAIGIILAAILGISAGLLINSPGLPGRFLTTTPPQPTNNSATANPTLAHGSVKLEVSPATITKSGADFNVVYRGDNMITPALVFDVDIWVSPTTFDLKTSTIIPGPIFAKPNYTIPFQNVKLDSQKNAVLFSTAGLKTNPLARALIKDGDVIARIHLASPKSGQYLATFDRIISKINDVNSKTVTGLFTDGTLQIP